MKFLTNNLRISSIISLLETENDFIFIRFYLLHRPTAIEQRIATGITKAVDSTRHDPINDPLDQISVKLKSEWIEKLIIHDAHEARLTTYNAIHTLVHRRLAKKLADTVVTHDETY
jgi:hypothetical protein